MRRIIAVAGLLALGLTPLTAEDKAPPAADNPATEKLIEQLGDKNFRTRESAAKSLEERGEAALPVLRKALEASSGAEARRRLQGIVTNLERIVALNPKRVTLKFKNRPVAEVIAAISKQTGYAIQYNANRGLSMTLNMENVTFWEAMDRICLDCKLMLQHNEGSQMMLYQQDIIWPYVTYQGPFKVMANNFHYNKQVTLGGLQPNPAFNQARSETLQFSFNIQSEPKLPIMQINQAKVIEAVDERGVSMKLPTGNAHETMYYNNNHYRSYNQSGVVFLTWPNKEARTVKLLKGNIPVTVLAFQKPEIIVDDILKVKNKKFTGANTELQVDEVKDANNKTTFQIKMSVRNLAPNAAQDYSWTNSVHQRIELLDAKGNRYYPQGYNWENSSPANVQATFMYGNNGDATMGPPARLVYNHWGMLQHTVEFEFRDLPLP